MCELLHYVYIPCYHAAATVLKYCDAVESCLRGDDDVVVRRRSFAQRRTYSEPVLPTSPSETVNQQHEDTSGAESNAWNAHALTLADAFSQCTGLTERTRHIRLHCDMGPHCPSLQDKKTKELYAAYQRNLQMDGEEPEWVAEDRALRSVLNPLWRW